MRMEALGFYFTIISCIAIFGILIDYIGKR